ncbi:hypothetical protein GNY06_08115 [Elizabethkingia argentiflava]|uniref:Nucleotidyltransferase family protein n=1 Tax=Elizabethkingia argenteiflava TaxID=2681556 RepID=A0A845PWV7_9FLAO|nr:nucleotidyltransferase family protein [Elizabethkingia argenteiflava]NAW51346.1 hypothetical protein [Elizabethkingia argenteiflava]
MLEDKVTKAFFTLFRAGLWNHSLNDREFPCLSHADWDVLFQFAVRQTVEGIVFDGVQKLDKDLLPPRELHIKWLIRVEQIGKLNRRMNSIITEQSVFFSKINLQPLLLKGQGVAMCYENPDRRVCGDIDWYFPSIQDFQTANQELIQRGFNIIPMPGYSSCYVWKDCQIDHHQKLFDLYNPFLSKYLRDLQFQQMEEQIRVHRQGVEWLLLSPLLQILQVNSHILKHLLSFGIGIRQLCDAAVLYKNYHNRIDGSELKRVYAKLKILRWINLLHHILVKYIGLPPEYLPFPMEKGTSADWMMQEIWQSGNFGFYDVRYQKETPQQLFKREKTKVRIWKNFIKYVPYAPMEAMSFPLIHFYSGLKIK